MITQISERDEISMKLLHYFITKLNYSPVIVQGVENEIWLQNLDEEYKVIRIVNNYIHNDEQLDFDAIKTNRMVKQIKRKTFTFKIKVLSILTDIGENVDTSKTYDNIDLVFIKDEKSLKKNSLLKEKFPDLSKNLEYTEEGFQLFLKITTEINKKNRSEAMENDNIFQKKKIVLTYVIMGILTLIFLFSVFGYDEWLVFHLATNGPFIRNGELYRLLSGAFIHIDMMHLFCNCYSLYVVGSQIENFYGKKKFSIIYIFSALCGSLLSIAMHDTYSIGASGAIFGLLGAYAYFGYHYRVYFGTVILKQIAPVIIFNLAIGFMVPGIDNYAHIGGLIGGFLISMATGVNSKDSKREHINGIMLSIIFFAFLIALAFFLKK
jgi:rhomboid protease GluP